MTTIIRVKRHRADDPVEALVLSCKRKKTEESEPDQNVIKKVLSFSGTVEDKGNKVARNTVHSFNQESKGSILKKTHTPEIRSKQRQERRERSEDNRFTLLSCLRSNNGENPDNDGSTEEKENYTIVDVSKDSDLKSKELDVTENCYVYDLYSIQDGDSDFNDIYLENLLSIQPLETELEYRNGEDNYEEIHSDDDDDSNDENNWRNDYPDTDSSMDDNEDDDILVKQLKHCHLGQEEYDLSCDSGEEAYLNYDDEDRYHYYEAEDLAGKRYARYKANALKQMLNDIDIDADGSNSDSDDDFRDCEVLSYHGDSD